MITLIVVKNPFAPYKGREIHKIKYKPDKTLLAYTKPYLFDNIDVDNMIFAVKGKLVNPDSKINDGDFIVMSPSIGKGGGKNPLLVVATIALSVAAMSLGAGFAGVSALSQATGWAAIGGYAVAAGVMYLGGTLINHAFGTAKKESTSNPTYSWDGITTTSGQGNPIPLTYGTVKSGGQTLSKFITISNDNQYLYWLISAGEGPLNFSDIEMNSNPIGYYKDTSYDIRNGTFNQSAIANFNDTVSTLALDQELLTDSYRQYNIDGNANQGLMIQVECSNGLYYANDNGSLGTEWVSIKADYCITGSNNWITFVNESISAAQTSAVRKQYRVDGIAAGTYTVRVICTGRGADIGSTRAQTRIWWTAVSGITYDDFCYPGIGLIGIKVLATDQLSGSPAVTFLKTRSTVLVYNPDKAVYEQQDATNPAWASYDAVHRAVDLYGDGSAVVIDGAPAELMMYDKFAAWAASCTAKNLHVNIEVNTADEMLTVINKNIACIGYGRVQLFGVKYGCTFDDVVDTPVQMFTMGNIIQGSFQEEFLQTSDRANAVEITFTNKDKNYERDTTTVYSDDYDEADQYNTVTSITMDGITSYEQAYAYGKYQLYCNKWLVRTCVFNASIDAIACNVGDVVALSHDVPEWACSGRITAVNGNTITMNGIFDNYDSAAAYQFQYRASDTDSLYTVEVSSITILSDGVQAVLASLGTDAPSIGDICDIAKVNIGPKWFTIKAITRSNNGEFERQITALEYNANVFSQNYTVPPQNYSTAQANQAQNVINISARQVHWLASDGTKHAHLYASWELPSGAYASKFLVYASTDNVNFNMIAEVSAFSIDFDTLPDTIYYLKIKTITNLSQSSGVTITADVGQDIPPNDVTGLMVIQVLSNATQVKLTWAANTDIDLKGYRVYVNNILVSNILTDSTYIYTASSTGSYTFGVVAVDNSGNESTNPDIQTVTITCEPADVAGFSFAQSDADRSIAVFTWNANTEIDLSYYEIRMGDTWDTGTVIVTKTKATTVRYTLPSSGHYTFWAKAVNAEGFYSVTPTNLTEQITLEPDVVTNLAIVQSTQDKSKAILSWTASSGSDISYYVVKYGGVWSNGALVAQTKEITLETALPGNGTFHYMVQAVTVAGYVSTIASIDIVDVSIQPFDVTNFKATQSSTDKTIVRLTWDAPSEVDIAYYVIKSGVSWDTGTILSPRVSTTLYDVELTDELSHTWLIKAVTIAGNESQYAASVSGNYDLRPTAVLSLQATQNADDRSILNIQWGEVDDGDLSGYQVKIGSDWNSGESLPFTRELYSTYTLAASGNYKVMIKAVNNAGYYSDELSISVNVQVEPSDVTGFMAFQNGDTVELYWNKSSDADVTGYEVHEGYSFDQGSTVATGITNANYTVDIDNTRTYRYFVKAINSSGKYSINAASASVTVLSISSRNVIETYDEIALASGTHSNTAFGVSVLNFQTLGGRFSDYPTTKFSDIGGASVLKLAKDTSGNYFASGTYLSAVIDVDSVITANVTTLFTSSAALKGGLAALYIRTSQDNTTWMDWEVFKPIQRTFRYIQFRIDIATTDTTKTPEVNQFMVSIDVPDTDIRKTVSLSAAINTISYGHTFYTNPTIIGTVIGSGLQFELLSVDKAQCTGQIVDKTNNDAVVAGSVCLQIGGY